MPQNPVDETFVEKNDKKQPSSVGATQNKSHIVNHNTIPTGFYLRLHYMATKTPCLMALKATKYFYTYCKKYLQPAILVNLQYLAYQKLRKQALYWQGIIL